MEANVQFSNTELELMKNADIILTKNKVLQKIKELFQELQEEMIPFRTGDSIYNNAPKISRGENYEGLPWLVLDYPRMFIPNNIFAIRTMFWWGNYFSSTLHISGERKLLLADRLTEQYERLADADYFMYVNEDPWKHHFDEANYIPIQSVSRQTFSDHVHKYDHVKIAAKFSLNDMDAATKALLHSWKLLLDVCGY